MVPQMDEKSSLGRFVVILGGLLRSLIFHKFLFGKKKGMKIRSWRQKGARGRDFGSAQRNLGGQRGTIEESRAEDF